MSIKEIKRPAQVKIPCGITRDNIVCEEGKLCRHCIYILALETEITERNSMINNLENNLDLPPKDRAGKKKNP